MSDEHSAPNAGPDEVEVLSTEVEAAVELAVQLGDLARMVRFVSSHALADVRGVHIATVDDADITVAAGQAAAAAALLDQAGHSLGHLAHLCRVRRRELLKDRRDERARTP